jgi:hypothetical protein
VQEGPVLRSERDRTEPVKESGDDGGDMRDGDVGLDRESIAPFRRSRQIVKATEPKLEALGIDGGYGSCRRHRHGCAGQGKLGVQTGILGMDGSQGLMLLRQLTLLRNDGTLISQQPFLISKLLLTSCKLAADEVQLLLDERRRRRPRTGGSGATTWRR